MLSARQMWMVSRHGIGRRGLIGRPSGGHRAILNMFNIARRRRPIGSRTCTTQLRVVINKTLSPYQPGSRTILYDSLVPTDALHATRPMWMVCRRDVGWFRPELPPTASEPNRGIGSAKVKRALGGWLFGSLEVRNKNLIGVCYFQRNHDSLDDSWSVPSVLCRNVMELVPGDVKPDYITQTKRGKDKWIYRGYGYVKDKDGTGGVKYWRWTWQAKPGNDGVHPFDLLCRYSWEWFIPSQDYDFPRSGDVLRMSGGRLIIF